MWNFIIPGFGTTYITVFEDNEGAKNLAQNPVCMPNSKHIDARPLFAGAYFFGELLYYSTLSFCAVRIPPLRVLHISSCTEKGGCFSSCSVQSTSRSSSCGCLRFLIIVRSFVFPGSARPRTAY